MQKMDETKAGFLAGLFIAAAETAKGGVAFADAFKGAFEHKETTTYEGKAPHRRVLVYRELSKVDEVLNRGKRERLVEGCECFRQCIKDQYDNGQKTLHEGE